MIGKKVKELRLKKGFSISELAKLANVSKSYISQLEREIQKNPSLQFLKKIALPLGTNIEYFLQQEMSNDLEISELDKEWKLLIRKAIQDGLQKEDFKEYVNFLKFQSWMKEQKYKNK